MPAYASGGVVYTRPLRAGSRRETAVTGGPESCNLGSGPVNSMVNIMNRPQVAALGPHVLCNLGGGYSPTATVARVSFFEGSPSGHKPNSSDASVSSGICSNLEAARAGVHSVILYYFLFRTPKKKRAGSRTPYLKILVRVHPRRFPRS
mgnify:CR=1 FL=1